MSRIRLRVLGVEALEGKLLLSTSTRPHVHAVRPPVIHAPNSLVLDGDFKGSIRAAKTTADAHPRMSMPFSGRSKGLGPVYVFLNETLNPNNGGHLEKGEITVANRRGSVHLTFGESDLVSMNADSSNASITARYVVDAGTGAYLGATGKGTFTLGRGISDVRNIHLILETIKS